MTLPISPDHANPRTQRKRSLRSALAVLTVVLLTLAACGSEPIPIAVPASGGESAASADAVEATPLAAPVTSATSEFGDILVNAAGLSVYGFTDDVDGVSVCDGGCASAWPPILVDSAAVPAGLDPSIFSVVARADGSNQLKAGKWPLYLFAGDTAAGQTTGHLSGDVWFLATPDGKLIGVPTPEEPAAEEAAAPALEEAAAPVQQAEPTETPATPVEPTPPVTTGSTALGDILVTGDGLSLYGFTNDVDGVSVCEGGCAEAWPPVLVPTGDLPEGLDASLFSVTTRPDGTWQLKAGKWPLYRFAGDTAAGQTTGHLSGDVWFLAAPDGKLIDFTPAAAPTAAPAPVTEPTAAPAPVTEPTATPVPPTPVPPTPTQAPGYGSGGTAGTDSGGESDY